MTFFGYTYNRIGEVRPSSTFASFKTYGEHAQRQQQIANDLMALADQVVSAAPLFATERCPFPHAQMFFLYSGPGRGKSHLVEAIINWIKEKAPQMLPRVALSRSRFMVDISVPDPYGDCPLVIIDDLFADKSSLDEIGDYEISKIITFIMGIYERRQLVIITSNFPMMEGLLPKIREADPLGRVVSRAMEILSSSGEIELPGDDYRRSIAEQRQSQSPGRLRLLGG
jgi:DNA replication protein DnaC